MSALENLGFSPRYSRCRAEAGRSMEIAIRPFELCCFKAGALQILTKGLAHMADRVTAGSMMEEEATFELSLRPRRIAEYIGQQSVKDKPRT